MTRRASGLTLAALLALSAPAFAQQYFLYSPAPLAEEEKDRPHDGVLVREVPVKKGDTLYGLSRRFSGHGSYFSQILLFNNISNPNLIYAGDTLRVPVTGQEGEKTRSRKTGKAVSRKGEMSGPAASRTQEQPSAEKKNSRNRAAVSESVTEHQPAARRPSVPEPSSRTSSTPEKPDAPAAQTEPAGQMLYERAMRAYRQDDCRNALDLFDQFLAADPASPLAADANLYKAECYLKMSSQ